jgi:hypothetical protein|tara:strand:- start:1275 stop:1493 length:219 start_codon:yes stop_codon:yes gene_type:complete
MPKPYITLKIDTGEEVWLEPESLVPQGLDQRVFRRQERWLVWAHFRDVMSNGSLAKWYNFDSDRLPLERNSA